MQKTKLGITIGMLSALVYFVALVGGYTPLFLLVGYILLFEEPNDFHKYLSYLEYYKELCKFEIFAYCLMPNHVHILLRHSPDCSLETIFRKLNTAYAIWFNRKYNRTGFVQNGM